MARAAEHADEFSCAERVARAILEPVRRAQALFALARHGPFQFRVRAAADMLRLPEWHVAAGELIELMSSASTVIMTELAAVRRHEGP